MAKVVRSKKVTKKSVVSKSLSSKATMSAGDMPVVESVAASSAPMAKSTPMLNPKIVRGGLVIVLIALLTYKVGPWLFPATVGYMPISRFSIWNKLEKSYGAQTLDDVVNEKVLDTALARQNVTIDQTKVDDQMKSLETQFESIGGLDEALKQRGLTRDELKKQIVTQLTVEEILKDKINPTDEEIKTEFETNAATQYKDKKFEDVKDEITANLKDAKLREAFLTWFADIKKDIKVNNFGL